MKKYLMRLWKDEKGAETVEWVAIAAIIILVGSLAYKSGGLDTTIKNALNAIEEAVQNAATKQDS
jgi:Flp pilus assembly pilin Flp